MSPPPQARSEATRRQIIESAYRLFLEQGYAATSMRQISGAAGVTSGGIYAHFASKEEIFSAVFQEYHPYLQVLPRLLAAEGITLEALVKDAARRLVQALAENREALKLMFIDLIEFQGRHFPLMFDSTFTSVLGLAERFSGFQNEMRPISLPVIVRSFIGLFFAYFMTGMIFPGSFPNPGEQDLDAFAEIYLHGIMRPA